MAQRGRARGILSSDLTECGTGSEFFLCEPTTGPSVASDNVPAENASASTVKPQGRASYQMTRSDDVMGFRFSSGNEEVQPPEAADAMQKVESKQQADMTCALKPLKKWEIIGMPCKHAMASIWNMASNGLEPGIPKLWVHETYWLKTWEEMYSYKINPCNGLDMWPQLDNPITLTTPNYKPPIGRPQKKRRKSATEIYDGLVKKGRLSRTGKTVTCLKCG
ncbi:hypothetical protein Tco_0093570 [Tanacetum coccineum]